MPSGAVSSGGVLRNPIPGSLGYVMGMRNGLFFWVCGYPFVSDDREYDVVSLAVNAEDAPASRFQDDVPAVMVFFNDGAEQGAFRGFVFLEFTDFGLSQPDIVSDKLLVDHADGPHIQTQSPAKGCIFRDTFAGFQFFVVAHKRFAGNVAIGIAVGIVSQALDLAQTGPFFLSQP